MSNLFHHILLQSFVLFVTTVREAVDDFRRAQRDKEINNRLYKKLVPSGFELIPSWKIKVGDLIFIEQGILFVKTKSSH